MSRMDIHGCIEVVREHFWRADKIKLLEGSTYATRYRYPLEAYSLNRQLQYRLCEAWKRNEGLQPLSERECVLLAEAWLIATPSPEPLEMNAGWVPPCVHCGSSRMCHKDHPENNPKNDPPDRWLCEDGKLYEPKKYE